MSQQSLALYFHWPFCLVKCPYCDFNSHVRKDINQDAWATGFVKEISKFLPFIRSRKVVSIFFGGGTPSLASPYFVGAILSLLFEQGGVNPNIEITLEANPTSVEAKNIKTLREVGVNRLSVGVQSFSDHNLHFLGRNHSAAEAIKVLATVAEYFDNYSFDLIYALSHQKISDWRDELRLALSMNPKHLSLYQLTLEPGTLFAKKAAKGELHLPPEDDLAEFYLYTEEMMIAHGFKTYETSNYSTAPEYQCRHNLQYWHYGDFLGVGPGAHSRLTLDVKTKEYLRELAIDYQGEDIAKQSSVLWPDELRIPRLAIVHHKMPDKWLSDVQSGSMPIDVCDQLNQENVYNEALLMGLRLTSGISEKMIIKHHKMNELISLGLLSIAGEMVVPTLRGRLLINSIVEQLSMP